MSHLLQIETSQIDDVDMYLEQMQQKLDDLKTKMAKVKKERISSLKTVQE